MRGVPARLAGGKPATKDTKRSAKSTTASDKTYEGFTDEERAAMKRNEPR
jgi:hypothetical protein